MGPQWGPLRGPRIGGGPIGGPNARNCLEFRPLGPLRETPVRGNPGPPATRCLLVLGLGAQTQCGLLLELGHDLNRVDALRELLLFKVLQFCLPSLSLSLLASLITSFSHSFTFLTTFPAPLHHSVAVNLCVIR